MDKGGAAMLQSTIFCSYAPGAGKTTHMLKQALQMEKAGHTISFDFVYDDGRPLPLLIKKERILSGKPFVELKNILVRNPEVSVIDELLMRNEHDGKPLYMSFIRLTEEGISVYSTVNLFHVRSLNPCYREIAGIDAKRTISDRTLLSLGKLVFLDIEPDQLRERYNRPEFFPQHAAAFRATYTKERLTACRSICLSFLTKLDPNRYEIQEACQG